MLFICLRAAEFLLFTFLPSLAYSLIIKSTTGPLAIAGSLILLIFLAACTINMGYVFMSAVGNRRVYTSMTGMAYVAYAVIVLAMVLFLGEEGGNLLAFGLMFFNVLGTGAVLSAVLSLLLIAVCAYVPSHIFVRRDDFYPFVFRSFYRELAVMYLSSSHHSSHTRTHSGEKNETAFDRASKNETDNQPTEQEIIEWREHERRRQEYEKRFTAVKPATFAKNTEIETQEQIIERKNLEKEARLQQYYFNDSKKKEHPTVDREEELKKARELQKNMNERKYHSDYRRHSHHTAEAVDKETEMRKARELKLQLEYEEAQKWAEIRSKR